MITDLLAFKKINSWLSLKKIAELQNYNKMEMEYKNRVQRLKLWLKKNTNGHFSDPKYA